MSALSKSGLKSSYGASGTVFADNTTGDITAEDQRNFGEDLADSLLFLDTAYDTIQFIIDGGGSAISTGVKGDLEIPFTCTVQGWTILGDVSGSIVVDIWMDTYANYPPTVADSITGSEKPTLSSAIKNQDLSLTTWTDTTLTRGDTIRYNVDSATTVTRATVVLRVKRSE